VLNFLKLKKTKNPIANLQKTEILVYPGLAKSDFEQPGHKSWFLMLLFVKYLPHCTVFDNKNGGRTRKLSVLKNWHIPLPISNLQQFYPGNSFTQYGMQSQGCLFRHPVGF